MKSRKITKCALVLFVVSSTAWADNIDVINSMTFENIGAANNGADYTGYGSVGYNYRISKYEVSIAQFAQSGAGNGNETNWLATVGSGAPVSSVTFHEAAKFCNWLTTGDANSGAYIITGGLVTGVDRDAAVLAAGGGSVFVSPPYGV